MGHMYAEPKTGQGSELGCRAFGIETRLYDLFGVRYDLDMLCRAAYRLCGFLTDWIHYHKKPEAIELMVRQGREMFSPNEVLNRLEGWFDETHKQIVFRSEEHTSELQSLMRIAYAVFCLKTTTKTQINVRIDTARECHPPAL